METPLNPLVDTHCHLYWEGLIERIDEVMARAEETEVKYVVVPGIDAKTSHQAQDLAARYDAVYFAAGLHPQEVSVDGRFEPDEFFAPYADDPKLVAVGEIGLDFGYRRTDDNNPLAEAAQREALRQQVEWAIAHALPVIIHNRDAGRELIALLEELPQARGVFHCFDGNKRTLKFVKERDFFISFAGNLTYTTAQNLRTALPAIPMGNLVVETDAPWLTPEPFRGEINEPARIISTAQTIATQLAKSLEIVKITLLDNSLRLFRFDRS